MTDEPWDVRFHPGAKLEIRDCRIVNGPPGGPPFPRRYVPWWDKPLTNGDAVAFLVGWVLVQAIFAVLGW